MTLLRKLLNALDKLLPADIVPVLTLLLLNILLNLGLRRDGSVVSTRQPERAEAPHTLIANHNILQSQHHRVTHVKHPRHVRWRHHNRKRLSIRLRKTGLNHLFRVKVARRLPRLINAGLNGLRIVVFLKLHILLKIWEKLFLNCSAQKGKERNTKNAHDKLSCDRESPARGIVGKHKGNKKRKHISQPREAEP